MAKWKKVDADQLEADLTSVAYAIREKAGTTVPLNFPDGFVSAVYGIEAGGGITEEEAEAMVNEAIGKLKLQSKTVTPTDAEQTITADEGYFGLASVIVEAAEGGGIPENARLYYVGNAVSELDMSSLSFTSSAVGELQEG